VEWQAQRGDKGNPEPQAEQGNNEIAREKSQA